MLSNRNYLILLGIIYHKHLKPRLVKKLQPQISGLFREIIPLSEIRNTLKCCQLPNRNQRAFKALSITQKKFNQSQIRTVQNEPCPKQEKQSNNALAVSKPLLKRIRAVKTLGTFLLDAI